MKPNDLVDMILVTPCNFFRGCSVTRQWATDVIGKWYECRSAVLEEKPGWEESAKWLKHGTLAFNYRDGDGNLHSDWAIGWEHVLGMYVVEKNQQTSQDRIADSQAKLVDMIAKAVKQGEQGEEWRGEQ